MNDDEIMARWNRYRERAEALATRCEASPETAALEGVQPDYQGAPMNGYRRNAPAPVNQRAAWLRGAATKVVPKQYRWQVTEAIGGHAALILLSHDAEEGD